MASLTIQISDEDKARVQDAAGGPRKVSSWVSDLIRAALDEGPRTVEAPRPDSPAPVTQVMEEAREVEAPRLTSPASVTKPGFTEIALPNSFMSIVAERAEQVGKSMEHVIVKSSTFMIENVELVKKVAAQAAVAARPQRSNGEQKIALDDPSCKHVWDEPTSKFGVKMSFCKKDGCESRLVG